jgi:hypothetical protein
MYNAQLKRPYTNQDHEFSVYCYHEDFGSY